MYSYACPSIFFLYTIDFSDQGDDVEYVEDGAQDDDVQGQAGVPPGDACGEWESLRVLSYFDLVFHLQTWNYFCNKRVIIQL